MTERTVKDFPIIEGLVDIIRDMYGRDIDVVMEDGKFFVTLPDMSLWGPMNHDQAWFALTGIIVGFQEKPTLRTERQRRNAEARRRLDEVVREAQQRWEVEHGSDSPNLSSEEMPVGGPQPEGVGDPTGVDTEGLG